MEPLTRILKAHDIQVTNKPVKTLQQRIPVPKFRPAEDDHCNVIKFCVHFAPGATLEKQKDPLPPVKKNIQGTLSSVPKAQTSLNTRGPSISLLILTV